MKSTNGEVTLGNEDYGDMPLEDFTHGLYRNVQHIKVAAWLLVVLELGKYFIW